MKKLSVLVALAALGVSFAGPSQAAGPYTIAGPAVGSSDGATRFKASGCNGALDGSAADGIDSQIVDVTGRGGKTLAVTWTAQSDIARTFQGQLTARFFSSACAPLGGSDVVYSRTPGPWSVPVPPTTKWMVVVSTMEAQVSFSFP